MSVTKEIIKEARSIKKNDYIVIEGRLYKIKQSDFIIDDNNFVVQVYYERFMISIEYNSMPFEIFRYVDHEKEMRETEQQFKMKHLFRYGV